MRVTGKITTRVGRLVRLEERRSSGRARRSAWRAPGDGGGGPSAAGGIAMGKKGSASSRRRKQLLHGDWLDPQLERVLLEIFGRFDQDSDNALNQTELQVFPYEYSVTHYVCLRTARRPPSSIVVVRDFHGC